MSSDPEYVQVWGDAVNPKHLWISVLLGAATGLGALLAAGAALRGTSVSPELQDGYSLLAGLLGCIVAAVVCAKLFPPKRTVREHALSPDEHQAAIQEIVAANGRGSTGALSPHAARELRSVGLHDAFARRQEVEP
ncbi:hypothetical protein F1721_28420 [Saccharopolyspora hirsuta]|uniref:Uncharacterized protein n=1 Tax=Saccharopolyspora hirsuta TaxID=1837 RepID=A0A5M7BI48_SACHI|nr:hypothetical protein [Saccharopolyspora hirsuta]KAA5828370.1 hypothetical protein F1721_28420 [Saccharopolyspora hirsuta]